MWRILFCFVTVLSFNQKPWVSRNAGEIEVLEFDPVQADIAYVSSKNGILAAINVKDGRFRWRQTLPEGERIDKMVVHKHKLVTLSAGRITRVWKSLEGVLVWEDGHYDKAYAHPTGELGNADIQFVKVNDGLCVLTLTVAGDIQLRKLANGEPLWRLDHTRDHVHPARAITVDRDGELIFTTSFPEDSRHMQVTVIKADEGRIKGSRTYELMHAVSTANVLFKGQYLVMLGAGEVPDIDIMYLDGDFSHSPSKFEQELPADESYSIQNLVGDLFKVVGESVTLVYEIHDHRSSIQLKEARRYKPVKVATEFMAIAVGAFQSREDEVFLCSIRQNFDGAEIEWYELATRGSHKQMVPFYNHEKHGDVLRIFPHVTPRGLSRALVLSEDHALTFVKNGNPEPLWVREESLASIKQMQIIDFPVELEDSAAGNAELTFSDFATRLQYDMLYIKSWLQSYLNITEGFMSRTDPEIFGFRQLIVALSKSGKIFGINSLTGKVIMKKFLPTLSFPEKDCQPLKFFQMEDNPHPIFAIVSQCEKSCQVLHFDIVKERILDTREIKDKCVGIYKLPDGKLAIMNSELQLHFVPDQQPDLKRLFMYNVDEEKNQVNGFGLREDNSMWPAWTVDFGPNEEIIKFVQRENTPKVSDTLHRPGGNRAIMVKYLNPHLIIVITKLKEESNGEFRGAWFGGINTYLIDTVTGAILEHIMHHNAAEPVALVTFENRVVYSFWHREKLQNVVIGLSLWGNRKEKFEDGFSSFTTPKLEVLQRAWFFDIAPITGLTVSESRYGFAKRTILATLANGQIYSIESPFVDPRQVEGDLKSADQEEGLMKYMPNIPFIPPKVITQGKEIARVSGIECGTAKVESTSLVVAYGIDVYATLMTPYAFDMLEADFDRGLLLLIVSGVLVSILISRYFAQDAILKRGWQ